MSGEDDKRTAFEIGTAPRSGGCTRGVQSVYPRCTNGCTESFKITALGCGSTANVYRAAGVRMAQVGLELKS